MNLSDLLAETIRDQLRADRGVCIYCGHTNRRHDDVCRDCGCDHYWNGAPA